MPQRSQDFQTGIAATEQILGVWLIISASLIPGCQRDSHLSPDGNRDAQNSESKVVRSELPEAIYAARRRRMIAGQLRGRDITNIRVLQAMEKVPRHQFVPAEMRHLAYRDGPLPIGNGQTISQPYIVALMTQLADPKNRHRALDVGTGSGYQAAVLAELVDEVYSIEIVKSLAEQASDRLKMLGYENVTVRAGDGYRGWPERSPFDIIIVAAAPDHVPQPLVEQLASGGHLLIPVGGYFQELLVIHKRSDGSIDQRNVAPVRFVPMTGEARQHSNSQR